MQLQISVSAASPLTALGKQVRALESQAAKARKILDAAKTAEAAGKSTDNHVKRLQEVFAGTAPAAPVRKLPRLGGSPEANRAAVKKANASLRVGSPSAAASSLTKVITKFAGTNKAPKLWDVIALLGHKVKNLPDARAAGEALVAAYPNRFPALSKQAFALQRTMASRVAKAIKASGYPWKYGDDSTDDRIAAVMARGSAAWEKFDATLKTDPKAALKQLEKINFFESFIYVFNRD